MMANRIKATFKDRRLYKVQVFGPDNEYLCDLPVTAVLTESRADGGVGNATLEFWGFRVELVEDDS